MKINWKKVNDIAFKIEKTGAFIGLLLTTIVTMLTQSVTAAIIGLIIFTVTGLIGLISFELWTREIMNQSEEDEAQ